MNYIMQDNFISPEVIYEINIPDYVTEFNEKGLEEIHANGCESIRQVWEYSADESCAVLDETKVEVLQVCTRHD